MDPFGWLEKVLGVPVTGSGQIQIGNPTSGTGAQVTVGNPGVPGSSVLLLLAAVFLLARKG